MIDIQRGSFFVARARSSMVESLLIWRSFLFSSEVTLTSFAMGGTPFFALKSPFAKLRILSLIEALQSGESFRRIDSSDKSDEKHYVFAFKFENRIG